MCQGFVFRSQFHLPHSALTSRMCGGDIGGAAAGPGPLPPTKPASYAEAAVAPPQPPSRPHRCGPVGPSTSLECGTHWRGNSSLSLGGRATAASAHEAEAPLSPFSSLLAGQQQPQPMSPSRPRPRATVQWVPGVWSRSRPSPADQNGGPSPADLGSEEHVPSHC
jgi:hypothetical protein